MASAQPIAATQPRRVEPTAEEPLRVTLLELVRAVSECTANEREVVATVHYMLERGRVQLAGCFRDEGL